MKILQIHHRYWPYPGGSERYVQEMSERLAADGHGVTVVTTDAWDIEHFYFRGRRRIETRAERHNGVSVARLPVRRFPLQRFAFRLLASLPSLPAKAIFAHPSPLVPSLRGELRRMGDVDLVHSAALPYTALVYEGLAFARRRGIPFAVTPFLHFGEPHEADAMLAHLTDAHLHIFRESDLIIAQTRLEREVLCRLPLRPDRIVVVGVGVNPGELTGGDGARFRARHGIAPNDVVILHVAEMSSMKGSIHLLEAVRRISSRRRGVRLVLAGNTMKDFQEYHDRHRDALAGFCVFPGCVTGEEKRDMFAACDVYAMPSKSDTFGIVYLEAWLARKPVIGAMAGGVPEVIEDGVDGFLVPFSHVQMLAEYLWKLVNDGGLRDAMGARGYDKVFALHTWDRKYALLRDLFLRLAADRGRTAAP
ncbi:MAG: glycosyltransferase family 4 protein [bacterium]|nr:glycosyltransferase family 4 protein [bacterium]